MTKSAKRLKRREKPLWFLFFIMMGSFFIVPQLQAGWLNKVKDRAKTGIVVVTETATEAVSNPTDIVLDAIDDAIDDTIDIMDSDEYNEFVDETPLKELDRIGSIENYNLRFKNPAPIKLPALDASILTEEARAYVVYNLPRGTAIKGQALLPKSETLTDGSKVYYQIVDGEALVSGDLKLVIQNGFSGEINLSFRRYEGNSEDTLTYEDIGTYNTTVDLDPEHILFAMAGSIQFNTATMEIGSVRVNAAPLKVLFKQHYTNPVVVAFVATTNKDRPVDAVVSHVETDSAWFQVMEPDGESNHPKETVNYIVVEAGKFTLPDGTKVEAGIAETNKSHRMNSSVKNANGGKKVNFTQTFSQPPVLLHTVNYLPEYKVFASSTSRAITKNKFRIQLELGATIGFVGIDKTAKIGWIAIESSTTGELDGATFMTGRTETSSYWNDEEVPDTISFQDAAFQNAPLLFAELYTSYNHSYGFWARGINKYAGAPAKYESYVYQERDQEHPYNYDSKARDHGFSFLAIEKSLNLKGTKTVPLDIIINPILKYPVIKIKNIHKDAVLLDKNGDQVAVNRRGSVTFYDVEEAKLLRLDITHVKRDHFIKVIVQGSNDYDEPLKAKQNIFINSTELHAAPNNETYIGFPYELSNYSVTRVANSFVVTKRYFNYDNGGTPLIETTRCELIKVDKLVFADQIISADQFYQVLEFTPEFAQKMKDDIDREEPGLVMVGNLPADIQVNNAVPIGNGFYAIPEDEWSEKAVELEFGDPMHQEKLNVTVIHVVASEEEETEIFNAVRISGYANAQVYASSGADASYDSGPNGIRSEARSYSETGAVATAGGSISYAQTEFSAEATAENTTITEIASCFIVSKDTGLFTAAKAGFKSESKVDVVIAVTSNFIPGTQFSIGGSAGVETYARTSISNELAWSKERAGLEFEGGAEAGFCEVGVNQFASGSLGGIGFETDAGVTAGLAAGVYAGGVAMYDRGTITIGGSFDGKLLVGGNAEVILTINTKETEDTFILITKGFLSGVDGVLDFGHDAFDLLKKNKLSIDLALRYYLIPIPDLIDIGKIHEGNILEVVYSELISIDDVMKTGLISDALAEKLGWEEVKGVWRGSIRFIEGHT